MKREAVVSRSLVCGVVFCCLAAGVGRSNAQEMQQRRRGPRAETPPAATTPPTPAKTEAKPEAAKEVPLAETTHTVTVNGKRIDYKATAGRLELKNDDGKTTAHVFFIAYTR